MKKIQLLIVMLFVGITFAVAQEETKELTDNMFDEVKTEAQVETDGNTQPDKTVIRELTPLSSYEFYLSLLVLGFGLIALLLEVWLIHTRKIDQDNLIKFIVVTIIITATLFLITAGYDNDQIAPAMGLLGTIAGYLLGKQEAKSDKKEKKEEVKTEKKEEKKEEKKIEEVKSEK